VRRTMDDGLFVACLCAQWCGSCREYRAIFEAVAASRADARFAWIDVEDQPHVMGEMEIENFPTVLIANGQRVAFFGSVTPHAATLANLVDRAAHDALGTVADPSIAQVAARARRAGTD
jgi:thioredoxin